jgi:hypothetical protein
MAEQHLAHGGIAGRAALRRVLVDGNEQGHGGTLSIRYSDI